VKVGPEHVRRAVQRLGDLAFVGMVDHWNVSVCLIHRMFGKLAAVLPPAVGPISGSSWAPPLPLLMAVAPRSVLAAKAVIVQHDYIGRAEL